MKVVVRKPDALTVDHFLARIDRCPPSEHWQLVDGKIVRRAVGGTLRHATIIANVMTSMHGAVRPRGGFVLHDMLVRNPEMDDTAVAPDVLVEFASAAGSERTVEEPVVVVEVLDPATMALDRGVKVAFYQTLPSIIHIVLIYQDEIRVETWSRPLGAALTTKAADEAGPDVADDAAGPSWDYRVLRRLDQTLALPAIAFSLPLAAVYDGLGLSGVAA